MTGPLEGIRVVALEQAVAMPFCTFALGELGAEVIKVERPGTGDVIRGWDSSVRGLSAGFVWLNANKRDVAIDLQTAGGRDVVSRLAATGDVFVENFAPGVAARLGLGPDQLRPPNPRLVYCSLSGFGQSGPYRDAKAYDLIVQGEAGILFTNGTPEAPAKVGLPIADLAAGTTAAIGVLGALYERELTGTGTFLDVAMLDSMAPWLGYFPHHAWHNGEEPPRTGLRHQYLCPYGPYRAADGRYVNLVVASDADWRRFCVDVVDRPEWVTDSGLATIEARRQNRPAAEHAVEAVIAARSSEQWFARLDAAGLAHGQVRTMAEVIAHPQLVARRMLVEASSPVGKIPLMRFPLGVPDRPRRIPGLGDDTREILEELGYTTEEVAALTGGRPEGAKQ